MKKSITLIIALAMILGMSQCKKNLETINPTPNNLGKVVHITLRSGSKDGKHIVHTNNGAVDYTDGDIVYVGNNGKYIGYLEYASGAFSGDIYDPSTEDYLHFYFVGGCTPSVAPEVGITTNFTVDISDQSTNLPVLSYVHTAEEYIDGTTTYEYMLLNKCGLVKFNIANTDIPASVNVAITGMNNKVTVHFDGEPFTSTKSGDGTVILNAVSDQERWAILPVQDAVSDAVATAYGHSASETFTMPAVIENMYYTQGVNVAEMETLDSTPLTFEAKTDGAKVKLTYASGITINTEYSIDEGATWLSYTSAEDITLTYAGDKVMFRAKSENQTLAYTLNSKSTINVNSGTCYVYGNVMSLLYQNFAGKTEFPNGSSYTFCGLFEDCSALYSHPTNPIWLPATTLAEYCYYQMFNGTTGLTSAPELPATTLSNQCYNSMFQGCTNLTTAPELPATTLAYYCYGHMFQGCTNLTTAPELPATTLAYYCYGHMFQGCTNLTTAPELHAETLAEGCCHSMFNGCASLTSAPELPATTLAEDCYKSMFQGCTNLTTAPGLPATTLAVSCYQSMFNGCTSLISAPELPATTLAGSCYREMFQGCISLTSAPELPAPTLVDKCYGKMFYGCSQLNEVTCLATNPDNTNMCCTEWLSGVSTTGTFTKAAGVNVAPVIGFNVTVWPKGVNGIPSGWTVVDNR